MNFKDLQQGWDKKQPVPVLDEQATSRLISQRIRKLDKSEKLLVFFYGMAALLAISLLIFWAYLFLTLGAREMRELDIFPPFGWFIMFPLFVALTGLFIIHNDISQKKKYNESDQKLNSLLEISKIQIQNRISIFRKIPFNRRSFWSESYAK